MKMYEIIIVIAVIAILIATVISVIKDTDKEAKQERIDQLTYLQECLERTTDTRWCYRRIFNLNLEVKE